MAASVMAASSFVGEKEKRTLETLLYCPLSIKEIFQAKIFASFIMSMMVSFASFFAMIIVVETEVFLTMEQFIWPNISWLFIMLLLAPSISLLAITFIVRISAKAQTMEEAQQRSAFLILPLVLVMVGQFSGILLLNTWALLVMGIVLMLIAGFFINNSMKKLSYEMLLK